jgi:hypothetical protein
MSRGRGGEGGGRNRGGTGREVTTGGRDREEGGGSGRRGEAWETVRERMGEEAEVLMSIAGEAREEGKFAASF